MYCAIIGDIIRSQNVVNTPEGAILQKKLDNTLDEINREFAAHISAKFEVTGGDEFQGLLQTSAEVLHLVEKIIYEMHPYGVRFGIGIGNIDTIIDPEKSANNNGRAYHLARLALTKLSSESKVEKGAIIHFLVRFETDTIDSLLLNTICGFAGRILSSLSDRQFQSVQAFIQNNESQSETAKQLGIAASTISRNLTAANYREYKSAINDMSEYLRKTYDSYLPANLRTSKVDDLIRSADYFTNKKIEYDLALLKLQQALSLTENEPEAEEEKIATLLDAIGSLLKKKGLAQKAIPYHLRALEIRSQPNITENSVNVAKSQHRLGNAYAEIGNYESALQWYRRAQDIRERELGNKDPDTITTYNNIAGVYDQQGKYTAALHLFKIALETRKEIFGESHPDYATSCDCIARVYSKLGYHRESLEWAEKALAIREKILGKHHPDTATSYSSIASIYTRQGKLLNALEHYFTALTIREETIGKDHPSTGATCNQIGSIFLDQGNAEKASEWYNKAMIIAEKALGREDYSIAVIHSNMAKTAARLGNFEEALNRINTALKITEKIYGKRSLETAETYLDLASIRAKQNHYDEAIEWYKRALSLTEDSNEKGLILSAYLCGNIASIYEKQKLLDSALEWYKKAFFIYDNSSIIRGNTKIDLYNSIANVYLYTNHFNEALQWYEKALAAVSESSEIPQQIASSTYYGLATVYDKLGLKDISREWTAKARDLSETFIY